MPAKEGSSSSRRVKRQALARTQSNMTKKRVSSSRWPKCQSKVTIGKRKYKSEEDSIIRWPWIPFIQDGGSLFFLEPYFKPPNEDEAKENGAHDPTEAHCNHVYKSKDDTGAILRGFDRIRGALKRNTALATKKERESAKDVSIESDKNISLENNNKSSDYLLDDSYEVQLVRKTTVLKVEKTSAEFDVDCNLLEDYLGIISGLDLDPVTPVINTSVSSNGSVSSSRMNAATIQGVISDGVACQNKDISIGDTILAVNGVEVTQRNINFVLSKIRWPSEVVLTIEKEVQIPAKPKLKSKIVDLVTGEIDDTRQLAAYQETCAVMYLTLDSNEDSPNGDIIFWYPDSTKVDKLKAVRGMFLTIADLMTSVTSTEAKSSTLLLQEEIIHVCYQKVGGNVLVIAAPDQKAFLPDNREDVQHLFVLFMEKLLQGLPVNSQLEFSSLTADVFGAVKYLRLPPDKHVWVSNAVCDAEAADYGECADDFFPHRRLYTILGSCLFYKGNLVCNHLPDSDLLDCILFCKHHCLFTMTEEQRVSQLVVWKEVFPHRKRRSNINKKDCFEEPHGRYFLQVVGQKHSLLAMLLEAGGAASVPAGSPGPHPYYVDTAASILAYIQETLDFETICEAKLRRSSIPALKSSRDHHNPRHNSISPLEVTLRKLPAHLESAVVRGEESPRSSKQSTISSPFSVRKSESKTSDDSSSNGSSMKLSLSNYSTISAPFKNVPIENGDSLSSISTKLTVGASNTLFYFTSCDKAKGILICPTSSCSDVISKEVLDNFHNACQLIRRTFSRNEKNSETNDSIQSDKIYEQGLLFKTKPRKGGDLKKSQHVLKYWVIGRKLNCHSREFFVCFKDGTPQSATELAFKFGFGTIS
eukprot:gene6908-7686_t